MSESETSGEATVAPAETVSAPSAAPSIAAKENVAPPAPTFGSGRGSGLARGKRGNSSPSSATANSATDGAYKPTAIQVVTAERQYKNPFAPEQPAAPAQPTPTVAPAAELPASTPVASAPAPAPTAPEIRSSVNETPAAAPTSVGSASASPEEKVELKILPPEERPRPAQSWESNSFPAQPAPAAENRPQRRDERPTFRPDRPDRREGRPAEEGRREDRGNDFRRGDRPGEPRREFRDRRDREQREPRDPREAREPRDGRESREPREPRSFEHRPAPAPTPVESKKGGFFGWLKGIFGGNKPEAEKPTEAGPTNPEERRSDGGQNRRRHHRGGRGRGGDFRGENRGPREGQPEGGGNPEGNGERRFEGGGRRRRHRGGRGRGGFRGDNRGGEPRSEGGNGPSGT